MINSKQTGFNKDSFHISADMEITCYICNKISKFCQQNLTEIRSKHSEKRVCDFSKQLMRDVMTIRNVEDESNCICGDCLKDVFVSDWACVEAATKEKKLIKLLLMTENSLSENRVEIKVEKDIDTCHTESIFVEDNHNLAEAGDIEIKSEPELILEDDVLMEKPPEIHTNGTSSTVTSPNPTVTTQQQTNTSADKTMFIEKDGKLVKVRLVKPNSNIKPMNENLLKTPDEKLVLIKFAGNNIRLQIS